MSTFLESQGLASRKANASDPAWLATIRNNAATAVLATDLPTGKTEAWRFTSVRKLRDQSFAPATTSSDAVTWAQDTLGDDGTLRIFLVNGRPSGTPANVKGVTATALSSTLAANPEQVEGTLGAIAHSEFFSAINAALFEDGLVLRVESSYQGAPIHIVHIAEEGASYPRLLLSIEANAKARIIETYLSRSSSSPDMCTAVTEVQLADGAHLEHTRVIEGAETSIHLGTLAVSQQRNSNYTSRSIAMGGKLSRLEIDARMSGPGAECHLDGMYHAIGSEHVAHHTLITHADDHGSSTEEYRGLIDDRAHAVFDGIIVVDQGTKGTSAHQQNHNLLLSDAATVNTKPHLEIDSDDLSASHGATVGSVNADHLFFLRARGIDENHARSILTFSFVRSIIDRITCEPVRDRLIRNLLSRLPYGDDLAELAK